MSSLPRLMVAPNGARLTQADHPALPITLDEIVQTAIACHEAGADGLHLHIRGPDGAHLLDVGQYQETLAALAEHCPSLTVQITTEAVGVYAPDMQRRVALETGCKLVSVAVREICRDGLIVAREFFSDCALQGIAVQHILYDVADAALLETALPEPQLRAPGLQLLFVLGRYSTTQESDPAELNPFLAWMQATGLQPDWAVCAFGRAETACLLAAARAGGKCRVGFENNRLCADGHIARDNAERVAELAGLLAAQA